MILTLGLRGVFILSDVATAMLGMLRVCCKSQADAAVKLHIKRQRLEVIKEDAGEEEGLTDMRRTRKERRDFQTVEEQLPGRHLSHQGDRFPRSRLSSTSKMLKREEEII